MKLTLDDLDAINNLEIREALLRIYKVPIEEMPQKAQIWTVAKKYAQGDKIEFSKALSVLINCRNLE